MMVKTCYDCKLEKPTTEYNKLRSSKDGFQYRCKPCSTKASLLSRSKRDKKELKQIQKDWYQRNRELSIKRAKQYHLDHPEWSKEMKVKHGGTWRKRYPEKAKELSKRQAFNRKLRKYNLSPEEFQAMHDKQEGKCAVCQVVPPDGLVIDHNHKTNKVRELLCNRCNPAVGMIGENPNIARSIITYLKKHQ